MKFIIYHLEPELYEWCLIEYMHISEIVGKQNLIFTNIKNKEQQNKLKKYGSVFEKDISGLNFKDICVLSQYSKKLLTAEDKNKFKYFIFGGILGDNPAQKRTDTIINNLKNKNIKFEMSEMQNISEHAQKPLVFDTRNLGSKQMPTDTAVYVAKKILDGNDLNDFKFIDEIEIEINENESVSLPFRYVVDDNRLIISEKLVEYLRKRKGF